MKAQFQFTASDLAEVGGRAVDRSPLVRKWQVRSRIFLSVILGILVFGLMRGELGIRLALAILVGGTFFWLASRGAPKARKDRLVQVYRERLGGDGPFLCEVEITEEAVVSRQLGTESRHAWSKVTSISEMPGGIEFIYAPMGSLVVRDRAFADAAARTAFLQQARSYHQSAPKEKP